MSAGLSTKHSLPLSSRFSALKQLVTSRGCEQLSISLLKRKRREVPDVLHLDREIVLLAEGLGTAISEAGRREGDAARCWICAGLWAPCRVEVHRPAAEQLRFQAWDARNKTS